MRYWEIIEEAVGGNYLYHGVPNGKTVEKIFKSGFIKPQPQFDFDCDDPEDEENCPPVISLTRSQYLRFPYGNAVAQFVIDKDALRQAGIMAKPQVGGMMQYKSETEERAYKPIPVKAPYVIAVQYDPRLEVPKALIKKAKENGVKVEPWKSVKKGEEKPEYSVDYDRYKPDPGTEQEKIVSLLKKGEPLPDWEKLYLGGPFSDKKTIYYKIPGWTYGYEIDPFDGIPVEFGEKILAQLQQLTKAGKSIAPIIQKYSRIQYGKDWKQGRHEIKPGNPKYQNPED